ncbi:hypothetical protein HU200_002029 [Digitaria exilis]|uniref:Amino acid transporter transmembrane domain-containing protein n=1 Tax=Digitaria exilis TaxID=1010633 RepID=A0A835FZD0_9POAL|nr:hypothetical protein HU200_002029 [Digitaria exilis]
MLSGILFQLFYGLMGSWTAYLISILYVEYRTRKEREKADFRNHVIQWFEVLDGLLGRHWRNVGLAFNCTFLLFGSVIQLIACASNIYYINDKLDKRTWTYIFGACCATTVFIPSFHNYRIWSFLGLVMTTYTAWYLAIASLIHGQRDHARDVASPEVQGDLPAGDAVRADADAAVGGERVLGVRRPAADPLERAVAAPAHGVPRRRRGAHARPPVHHLRLRLHAALLRVGELIGLHDCRSLCKRAAARLPVVVPIWFLAIVFPFFGPINSAVGSLLVSFTVYIIPALAHMITFRSATAREPCIASNNLYLCVATVQNAVEPPPRLVGRWTGTFIINAFVVAWVLVVGFGFGGWASITNFVHQIDTFGLFTKCYQCPPPPLPPLPFPGGLSNITAPIGGAAAGLPPAAAPSPAHFLHHHRHHGHGLLN